MFLAKNSDYRGDIPLSVTAAMRSSSKAVFNSQRQWGDTEDVHEFVESIYNYDLVIFHLRPWSFESRAVIRAFHSVR